MTPLLDLERELDALRAEGLLRAPVLASSPSLLVLCGNDYLGYAREPLPPSTHPAGAGASRLVSGDHPEHRDAERALATWLGQDDALLFSSGYAANVGVLSAVAGPGDVIVSDALNHASIIDGCRLSRAEVVVVPHGEADAFAAALAAHPRARRRWLVTESYFSMDGDSPDLARLRAIADEHQAGLVVDEAHALGVLGPEGRGACAAAGVAPDIFIGTLGKALGLAGAFVAGPQVLRRYLWNRARSFVFSTGISPVIAAAVPERVARCRADDAGRERLASLGRELRGTFPEGSLGASHGPILPWIIGDEEEALAHGRALAQAGILVVPIRPPTVPRGTSRLRITLHAKLSDDELRLAAEAFAARRC